MSFWNDDKFIRINKFDLHTILIVLNLITHLYDTTFHIQKDDLVIEKMYKEFWEAFFV